MAASPDGTVNKPGLTEAATPDTASEQLQHHPVVGDFRGGYDGFYRVVCLVHILDDALGDFFRHIGFRRDRGDGAVVVVDGIKQIADVSKKLSIMISDQNTTMRQAEEGVGQISEVVQNNSATAQETSATSEELSAQAVTLDELVGQFTLMDE